VRQLQALLRPETPQQGSTSAAVTGAAAVQPSLARQLQRMLSMNRVWACSDSPCKDGALWPGRSDPEQPVVIIDWGLQAAAEVVQEVVQGDDGGGGVPQVQCSELGVDAAQVQQGAISGNAAAIDCTRKGEGARVCQGLGEEGMLIEAGTELPSDEDAAAVAAAGVALDFADCCFGGLSIEALRLLCE